MFSRCHISRFVKPAASSPEVVRCAASVLLLWFLFYLIGEGLASLPDSFHQGTLWQVRWFERE